ncbi:hypothetical protein SADUNF_Sadunf01G0088600 [Salix dunnii]|uniref:Uncharacterized protein n=1 Tax=Salix dunnii TaxID=1413687 RepID=A0A835TLY1_9ROSI|nr:hypothetical protein SADUNF_Sadunf01G0088600 [Salix dunnii]
MTIHLLTFLVNLDNALLVNAFTNQLMRYLALALIDIRPNESAWSKPLHSRYEYPLPLLAMIWDSEDSNDAPDTSISGRLAGTSLTKPVPAESFIIEGVDFFTNRQPKPDGFSPKTLKKEQTRKSGIKRERPRVSISLGPKPQASSKTCHPFSRAMFIQSYEYLAPVTLDWSGKTNSPLLFFLLRLTFSSNFPECILKLGHENSADMTCAPLFLELSIITFTASFSWSYTEIPKKGVSKLGEYLRDGREEDDAEATVAS